MKRVTLQPQSAPAGGWKLGLDLGSTAAKAVLLNAEGTICDMLLAPSGLSPAAAAARLTETLFSKHGIEQAATVATGYGRALAMEKERTITEISCHAKGVKKLHPDVKTVLDIGGQDAKAIRVGADGVVEDFAMNDRCAAGTGCFLEVAARKFDIAIHELSDFCGNNPRQTDSEDQFEISSTCVVFAESELIGLTAKGTSPIESLKAVHRAIARRVSLLLQQIKACPPLYFTGGVAQNITLAKAIEYACGIPVTPARHPQFAGALGAALFA